MGFQRLVSLSFAAVACATLAGCGGFDFLSSTTVKPPAQNTTLPNDVTHDLPVSGVAGPGEKLVTLPMQASDYDCPIVSIREGGAALRVGGPSNDSVRYQLQINDVARECDPAGTGQVAIKIGVSGAALIGPAGSPGSYSGDLRVTIVHDTDKKTAFERAYKATATADATGQGAFQIVTDPITLPIASPDVADEYSIYVGFGARPQHRSRRWQKDQEKGGVDNASSVRSGSNRQLKTPSGKVRFVREPAPKAQPPRKRSGPMDRWGVTLWKATR